MKALLTLTAVLAAIAIAAPTSLAAGKPQSQLFITDTLGGNGHASNTNVQGYRFTTDTLGGSGGAQVTTVFRDPGFSWGDAGIGAAIVAGSMLILFGSARIVLRRRTELPA
jgi:hypothetical protein